MRGQSIAKIIIIAIIRRLVFVIRKVENQGIINRVIIFSMIRFVATIHGKVQGVHYRVYAQDAATTLGVVGSVCNKPDGTVVVVAEAFPDVLKEFVEYLHEGSLHAQVESVSLDWRNASGTFTDFAVLQ